MVALVSRTGRHLQRYNQGRRQVVGCIPYRYRVTSMGEEKKLEVLVISSQKEGKGMLFPKRVLGIWHFKSKNQDTYYEGYMFPLLVEEQLEFWPEKDFRQRIWMSVTEAKESCQHGWMKEALDVFVRRLGSTKQKIKEAEVV